MPRCRPEAVLVRVVADPWNGGAQEVAAKLGPVRIHSDIMGSDHCPVSVNL